MAAAKTVSSASRRLSKNLRAIRMARNISQSQLSKASGLPKSTINHIEAGISSPSIDSVDRLASALGISIEELLSAPTASTVEKRTEGQMPVLREIPGIARILRLLPDPFPGVDFYVLEIEPGGSIAGVIQSPKGRKFIYCVSGSAKLVLGGETHDLPKGSTAVFPGDEAHSFRNSGRSKTILIKVHLYAESKAAPARA